MTRRKIWEPFLQLRFYVKLYSALLLFGSLAAHSAPPPEIFLNATPSITWQQTLENVRTALTEPLSNIVVGEPIVIQIGVYKDLRKLTLAAGMNRSTAMQAIAYISRILEANKGKDNVIGLAYKYLERHRQDEHTLLVCVFSRGCRLPVGSAFVADESRMPMGPINPSRFRRSLESPIPHLILLNGPSSPYGPEGIPVIDHAMTLAWAIDFLTAATSFADYELISEWVQANTRLLQAGQRSDELFDRFVRIVPAIKVDVGFVRVLSSSRASAVALAAVRLPPSEQRKMRDESMFEIRSAWDSTERIATQYNLSADNIVEFGERVTKEMAATIRRAR